MGELKDAHPGEDIEIWSQDEHRIGLKPVIRRMWILEGERPTVKVNHRFTWTYLYGFVCPFTGDTHLLILPYVNVDVFNIALESFSEYVNKDNIKKHIILVLDNSGWHKSSDVVIPDNITFIFTPPYTPELQPSERLWPLTNEGIANKCFDNLEHLEAVQAERCYSLGEQYELIKSTTNFHWWPENIVYSN